jgi:hypothetical protein
MNIQVQHSTARGCLARALHSMKVALLRRASRDHRLESDRHHGGNHGSEDRGPFCEEPSIEKMLADPLVRALMAADGVKPAELEALWSSVAKRCRRGVPLGIKRGKE